MTVPDAVRRQLYSTVTISFPCYMYSHCLHEGLTLCDASCTVPSLYHSPVTCTHTACTRAWRLRHCRLDVTSVVKKITGVGCRDRLVSQAPWCTIGTAGLSAGHRFYWLILLCYSFQCSVRCTGYCRLLTNPHLLPITSHCFPCLSTLHSFWSSDSIDKQLEKQF